MSVGRHFFEPPGIFPEKSLRQHQSIHPVAPWFLKVDLRSGSGRAL